MKKLLSIIAISACLVFPGCAAKRTNTTNPAPVTKWEQVNSDNAQISIHNRALAKSLIAIHQAGFINTEYFDKLSRAGIRITQLHKDLTPMLKSQDSATAGADQVKAILDELKTITSQMVTDGSAGITNPNSKSAVLSDISAIVSAVDSIYSVVEVARGK